MQRPIPEASEETTVLLVHAPYPGRLKFGGLPSSLLHAIAPFAASGAAEAIGETLGYLDPGTPSEAFYGRLRELVAGGRLRAACISTSTAAIEETARVVRTLREGAGDELLVVVGGPHEDDCDRKVASAIAGIDLSIGGDAEFVLELALCEHLEREDGARATCKRLEREFSGGGSTLTGKGTVTSPWWSPPQTRSFVFKGAPAQQTPRAAVIDKEVRFPVFRSRRTLPVMVSRGCAYGRCTFCAEGIRGGGQLLEGGFAWLEELLASAPGAALYFQDSIFPNNRLVRDELLPLLRSWGGEWGCQVYLPALPRNFVQLLAGHGCTYVYTGLESASSEVLVEIGKPRLNRDVALERIAWLGADGLRAGLSLMFGSMTTNGTLLETEETVDETVALAETIASSGVHVAGFYPNVQTVLPGTALARGLEQAGHEIEFYRVPRSEVFDELEDGGVGYNFLTLPAVRARTSRDLVAQRIVEASTAVQRLGTDRWDPTAGVVSERQPRWGRESRGERSRPRHRVPSQSSCGSMIVMTGSASSPGPQTDFSVTRRGGDASLLRTRTWKRITGPPSESPRMAWRSIQSRSQSRPAAS